MVSHETFIILGYVYAILGTLGSLIGTIQGTILIVNGIVNYAPLIVCFIVFPFFVIFLVGILEKNLTCVKMFRIYLMVFNVFAIGIIMIGILEEMVPMMFSDEEEQYGLSGIIGLLVSLGIVIGLYLLFQWIVNGVIAAIKNEKESNGDFPCKPDAKVKSYYPSELGVGLNFEPKYSEKTMSQNV